MNSEIAIALAQSEMMNNVPVIYAKEEDPSTWRIATEQEIEDSRLLTEECNSDRNYKPITDIKEV
jgi:hypothetical protein